MLPDCNHKKGSPTLEKNCSRSRKRNGYRTFNTNLLRFQAHVYKPFHESAGKISNTMFRCSKTFFCQFGIIKRDRRNFSKDISLWSYRFISRITGTHTVKFSKHVNKHTYEGWCSYMQCVVGSLYLCNQHFLRFKTKTQKHFYKKYTKLNCIKITCY